MARCSTAMGCPVSMVEWAEAWYLSWQFLKGWRHFLKPSQKAESGLGLLEQQVPYLKSSQLQQIDCLQVLDSHVCGYTLLFIAQYTQIQIIFLSH